MEDWITKLLVIVLILTMLATCAGLVWIIAAVGRQIVMLIR